MVQQQCVGEETSPKGSTYGHPDATTDAGNHRPAAKSPDDGSVEDEQPEVVRVSWTKVSPDVGNNGGKVEDIRRALLAERERTQMTLLCVSEGVIITDAAARVDYLNPVAETLTGVALAEARGEHISRVLRLRDEESGASVPSDLFDRCLAEDRLIDSTDRHEMVSREGAFFSIDYLALPIRMPEGEPLGIAVILRDVTLTRQAARQFAHDASHDPQTGLVNSREFERRLARALASAESHHAVHVLVYLDLDSFGRVNAAVGHDEGDRLLRRLRDSVATCFRERDTFARLGGDEFGVLLENCALEDGIRICEAVLGCLRHMPLVCQDQTFAISASAGLVAIADGGSSPTDLLRRADAACCAAKAQGGDRFIVFEADDMSSRRHQDISRVSVLRDALDRDRLRLYFQPIVPLQDPDETSLGMELLLRCLDPNGGVISPGELIPAAERYGLMRTVDRWVIERACRFLAESRRNGTRPAVAINHLAVNLSGSSVGDESLPGFLRQQFAAYDLPANCFCFEITETCAIHNLELAAAFVRELQRIGCTVALDDFGSGLSSFSYLKALPVDFVKIDGGFVKDMLQSPVDHAVVVAIKEIAAMMGARCIAEYVHSAELLSCLRSLSVEYAQGDAIGAASPLENFEWGRL